MITNEELCNKLNQEIQKFLDENKVKQLYFCEKFNIPKWNFSLSMCGNRKWSLVEFLQLSRFFNLDADFYLNEEKEELPA